MRKLLLLAILCPGALHAACNTSTLVTTPDSASFAQCFNQAVTNGGGTVTVLSGSVTWTTAPTFSTVTSGVTVIVQGATTAVFSGTPGQSGYSATWTDNTKIQFNLCDAAAFNISGSGFLRITGISWIQNASSNGQLGCMSIFGAHTNLNARFDHNHVTMFPGGGPFLFGSDSYGLSDDNEFDDTGGGGGQPMAFGGDSATFGYVYWQDPTNLGTNQSWIAERNIIVFLSTTDGALDLYYGAKSTFRFNNVKISGSCQGGVGWSHGLDSGGERSTIALEIYGNLFDNETGGACLFGNSRGGVNYLFKNTFIGNGAWNGFNQQYFRCEGQQNSSGWGLSCATWLSTPFPQLNLAWVPVAASTGTTCGLVDCVEVVTLNAPDWQASHSYTCSTAAPCEICPTSGGGGYNYIATANGASGGTRPTFNQTFPPVAGTTDSTMTWYNVGGVCNASPNPGVAYGFLPAHPDNTGTTSSYTYAMDGLGGTKGTYPFRDQIGRIHDQVLSPDYEWLDGGAQVPSPTMGTDAGTSAIIVQNQDYYLYTASFNGTVGVGSGTLAARPATCTTGVAYWDTSEGSWNNGAAGSGALDICVANAWVNAVYTPYAYPDPLEGITSNGVPSPPSIYLAGVR